MDKTGIIWTEKTWNPVTGCRQISEGCRFCYAKTIAENYSSKAFPNKFDLTLRPHKLKDPFKWKEPSLIFVNSMSDLFWEEIPEDYLNSIIDVIEETPQHIYQVLTKRSKRMLGYSLKRNIPENMWIGVTIENKRNLERLHYLKLSKAKTRFISFEPLLEDLGYEYSLEGIDWVITGGESGTHLYKEEWQKKRGLVYYDRENKKFKAKQESIRWIENIREKCLENKVKFFHKQWGGNYPEAAGRKLDDRFYDEIPYLPGNREKIKNEYLEKITKQEPTKERQQVLF
jgi:protein gp37